MFRSMIILFFLILSQLTYARPEYAAREKLNCIQCHVSPWGAGHRRITGKAYGSRDLGDGSNSDSDRYYADFRGLFLKDTRKPNKTRKNGFGIMTTQVSAFVPIVERDSGYSTSVLGNFDLGSFKSGPRETYLLFENTGEENWYKPSSILVGRFYLPFGLLTDEHRTYTKMQTSSSLRDYETGGVFSFDPLEYLHIDMGYFNGFGSLQNGNGIFIKGQTYGLISNIRFNHESLPFMLGASWIYQNTDTVGAPNPYAWSHYAVISLNKLISEKFQASILTEIVFAKYYNDRSVNIRYIGQFIPAITPFSNYGDSIKGKKSRGILAEFKWEITPQWIFLYKFDHLIFDTNFNSDSFSRHGIGFRYQVNSNSLVTLKYEIHNIRVPGFKDVVANTVDQSDIIAVLRVWL